MQYLLLHLHLLRDYLLREEGQDLVEYSLVVALMAFGSIVTMSSLSNEIGITFGAVSSDLNSALA